MLRTYFQENYYDMPVDVATKYAVAIREAILAGKTFDGEKKQGFYISKNRHDFQDKLYVGNIHRIENQLYWRDEELADDDEIVNVVVIDGPVTRDGDGCSYGSKDHRDQILYANTIPQVVGHIFIINTPGGAASSRIDYEQAIKDCREKGKPTVAWVDGLCCSAGQWVASMCDRTIAMNGKDTMGCIGTMCAFWGVANNTVSQDGYRYIELVSVTSPDKNRAWREACEGKTEKMQEELNELGEIFRDTVRKNRPKVKDEHLTGKTFEADEVMGILVDEIGNYDRAIQAVFDLAGGVIPNAREVIPGEEESGSSEGEEQQDLAKLNAQQKAAIAANAKEDIEVDNGHVKKEVQTFLGPSKQEMATPKNNNNMTEEEKKKAAEAAAAQAAKEEQAAPATEEATVTEEAQAVEQPTAKGPTEEASAEEAPAEEAPAEEAPAEEAPTAEALANAEAEITKIQETLHNAEEMVADRDKTIEEKAKEIENLNAQLTEKDAAIEQLQKKVADLEAEVKEISASAAPMSDGNAGVPAGNGNGAAPQVKQARITSDMNYKQIRAALAKK